MAGSTQIDAEAPFSGAFSGKSDGWKWVSNVIGVGASFGILTSLLVAMLGQARYMCVIGRSSVVPAWFARIHPKTSTPVNASAFLGTVFYFVYTLSHAISGCSWLFCIFLIIYCCTPCIEESTFCLFLENEQERFQILISLN